MLEGILYFSLGFLAAALLALMVAPIIWQRAVLLTRRRIERSVPLTLNEIQADKDQLRAEFAMSTRRLEMSIEELREKASSQIIEINRKRDDLAKLNEEQAEKLRAIEDLQARASEMRSQLRQREDQLEIANRELSEVREQLHAKALEAENIRGELNQAKSDADSRRIELVARQTEVENLSSQLTVLETDKGKSASDAHTTARKLASLEHALEQEKARASEMEQKWRQARELLTNQDERRERSEMELTQLRDAATNESKTNTQLTSQLVEEKSRSVELEAKLAQLHLQMEALLADASNDNVEKAMASLQHEKNELATQMETILAERDSLKDRLTRVENTSSDEWETERRENAILRERINDLAAQVTSMTAALEGDGSPIDEILSRADNVTAVDDAAKPAAKASRRKPAGDKVPPESLADRIRALRDTARQSG